MLFCQFGRAHSLREICGGLASCEGKLKPLGVSDLPKRSTLAYANANRTWLLYQAIFEQLLAKCQSSGVGFRLGSIPENERRRQTPPAPDHDGYLASFAVVTNGKISNIKVAATHSKRIAALV